MFIGENFQALQFAFGSLILPNCVRDNFMTLLAFSTVQNWSKFRREVADMQLFEENIV